MSLQQANYETRAGHPYGYIDNCRQHIEQKIEYDTSLSKAQTNTSNVT